MTRSANSDLHLSRRDWLRLSSAGVIGYSLSGWLGALANEAAKDPDRKRSCILLWMNGGPSQMDTFDLKPGHKNGGSFKETQTSVPGIKISEHLPQVARFMDKMAIVRSMSTKEGDHGRATYLMRTGYLPVGSIEFPAFGSLVAKELGNPESELPNFVSIAPFRFFNPAAYSSGFLGPRHAPLVVGDTNIQSFFGGDTQAYEKSLKVEDLELANGITREQADARLELMKKIDGKFLGSRPGVSTASHQSAYERAVRLMKSPAARAFNLDEEKAEVRDAYGRNLFGQGCLLARRLVERNVPFVEVTLANAPGSLIGWDTHQQNFEGVKALSRVLDPAWATLMKDLKERGLLDSTLIVWMGEFGRTPRINGSTGRDHYPNAWSTVLAGGGIKGGQVVGKTSADGTTVEDRKVNVAELLATVCKGLGINHENQNLSNVDRPIRIVEKGAQPIQEVVG